MFRQSNRPSAVSVRYVAAENLPALGAAASALLRWSSAAEIPGPRHSRSCAAQRHLREREAPSTPPTTSWRKERQIETDRDGFGIWIATSITSALTLHLTTFDFDSMQLQTEWKARVAKRNGRKHYETQCYVAVLTINWSWCVVPRSDLQRWHCMQRPKHRWRQRLPTSSRKSNPTKGFGLKKMWTNYD